MKNHSSNGIGTIIQTGSKRRRKAREILTIWSFWLTIEKVGSGFQ